MKLLDFYRLVDRSIEHMGGTAGFYAGVKPWDVIESLADLTWKCSSISSDKVSFLLS